MTRFAPDQLPPEISKIEHERLLAMSAEEKFSVAAVLWRSALELRLAALRARAPERSEAELRAGLLEELARGG